MWKECILYGVISLVKQFRRSTLSINERYKTKLEQCFESVLLNFDDMQYVSYDAYNLQSHQNVSLS